MARDYYAAAQAYQTQYSQMARRAITAGETPSRDIYKWAYAAAFYYLKAIGRDFDPSAIRNDKEQSIMDLYQKLQQDEVKYYHQKLPAIVVMQDLYDRFQFKIDEIDAEFDKQVHKAVDYVERQVNTAKQFVSDRVDDVKQFATDRVNDVKQFATDRVHDVKQFAHDRVNDAKAGLKALFRPVTKALTDIKANVDMARTLHRLEREQASKTAEDWLKAVQTFAETVKDQAPAPVSEEERINNTEEVLNDLQQMVSDFKEKAREPEKDVEQSVEEQVVEPVEKSQEAKEAKEEVEAIFSKEPAAKEGHKDDEPRKDDVNAHNFLKKQTWNRIQEYFTRADSWHDRNVSFSDFSRAYWLAMNTLWTFAQDALPKDVWEKNFPGFSQKDYPNFTKVSISTLASVLKENTDLFLLSPNTISRLSMIEGYNRDILKNNIPFTNSSNPFTFPEVGKGQASVPAFTRQNAILLAKDLQDVMSACQLTREVTPKQMNDEDFKRVMYKKHVLDNQVLGFPDVVERDRTEEKTEDGPAMEKTNDAVMEETEKDTYERD